MLHRLEFFGEVAANTLSRRVGENQIRKQLLQFNKLVQEHIEVIVADSWLS